MIIDENRFGIIATTGSPLLKQGIARPILVEVVEGKAEIDKVLVDIYYLSFMHWGSVLTKMKLPATIKYADDLASFAEMGIKTSTPPL